MGILPVDNKTKSTSAVEEKIRLTIARDVTKEKEEKKNNNSIEKRFIFRER